MGCTISTSNYCTDSKSDVVTHENPGTPDTQLKVFINTLKILCHPICIWLYLAQAHYAHPSVYNHLNVTNSTVKMSRTPHSTWHDSSTCARFCPTRSGMYMYIYYECICIYKCLRVPICSSQLRPATHCNSLRHTATHCTTHNFSQFTASACNTWKHTATHYNTLQHSHLLAVHSLFLLNLHLPSPNYVVCFVICCSACSSMCCSVTRRHTTIHTNKHTQFHASCTLYALIQPIPAQMRLEKGIGMKVRNGKKIKLTLQEQTKVCNLVQMNTQSKMRPISRDSYMQAYVHAVIYIYTYMYIYIYIYIYMYICVCI